MIPNSSNILQQKIFESLPNNNNSPYLQLIKLVSEVQQIKDELKQLRIDAAIGRGYVEAWSNDGISIHTINKGELRSFIEKVLADREGGKR